MYESESNSSVESLNQLPQQIIAHFCEMTAALAERTVLPWGEHCTECAWPTCYTSCDLYVPRHDGRCRRFVNGMVRIACAGSPNGYILKLRFKHWGKLWTPGNIHLVPTASAMRLETRDNNIAAAVQLLPDTVGLRKYASIARYKWKKHNARSARVSSQSPDLFLVECYNPSKSSVGLSLTMAPTLASTHIPFQRLITIHPGFHREEISLNDITLDLSQPFDVDITPNDLHEETALYFGLMDFVRRSSTPGTASTNPRPVKCVIWDLDGTLWDGVLVEDGVPALALRPGILDIIKELDRHGVLHSIASKNNFDEATAALQQLGLQDYFLYPQISWGTKSDAIRIIAKELNIGTDSLMFVDDSPFELAQVGAVLPDVQLLPAERSEDLLRLPECHVPITQESSGRRALYQQQGSRKHAAVAFGDDYISFLRDCHIAVHIDHLSELNIDRVHELTQRTNQMNFSGNRYDRSQLQDLTEASHLDTFVIDCKDKFGSYGIIGFCIVDSSEPRLLDLMFSCRVQAKRVEHAVLTYLLRAYTRTNRPFRANYRKTPRNAQAGRVFSDLGFIEEATTKGVTSLLFPTDMPLPVDDGIVSLADANRGSQLSYGNS